ncbi:MAG: hypothetical protein RBU37_15245 [Myxococcota bacterium]|jgi:hypothetical protein|nr:hypothetical protein [Myxococcota bacterium]
MPDRTVHADRGRRWRLGVWGLALGYFAAYVPYSMLAKGLSRGLFTSDGLPVEGPVLLPLSSSH